MTITNNSNSEDKVQNLVDLMENSPDKYKHLQVFLHRERPDNSHQDYEFLMVSPKVFGKVRILNVDIEDDFIILEFLDCSTILVGNVKLDIHENNPQTFFICWRDIKQIVLDEPDIFKSKTRKSELLEFNF